jgi:hypothetical protein
MIPILKSRISKIILGILWGLGLACLFRKVCRGRNCIIYKAPDIKDIKDNIYNFNDSCYQYNIVNSECSADALVSKHHK